MKLAIDVGYHETGATAAGVLFHDWVDRDSSDEVSVSVRNVVPYQSGQFYKRELPCMISLLNQLNCDVEVVIVDGFVWLSKDEKAPKPGLGAFLFEHLEKKVPVIGVAKTEFAQCGAADLLRGNSRRPLFISSVGIEPVEAIQCIKQMHGEFRIPTLLKRVDSLSRVVLS